jgi:uncharacterized protein (TIGR02118 family)
MMKSICALARRPDLDRAAFQRYYEERHALLGIRHFPFRRYVRNHLVDAADIGFDTISEFWADDIAALAALMDGPVGDILRADEERFMDRPRIAPAGSDERVLSAGAPVDGDGLRTAILVGPGVDGIVAAQRWAEAVAQRTPGVSTDRTQSWREPAFPAGLVVWLPGPPVPGRLPPNCYARAVLVRRVETPAEQLERAGELG